VQKDKKLLLSIVQAVAINNNPLEKLRILGISNGEKSAAIPEIMEFFWRQRSHSFTAKNSKIFRDFPGAVGTLLKECFDWKTL